MSENGENGGNSNGGDDDSDGSDGPRDESTDGPSTDGPSTDGVSLSLDATLEILANRDRRAVLAYLLDAPCRTATIDELADHLVERQTEQTGERPGRDHVLTTLHHVHVPKLADAGVVEYDARSQELRYWGSDRLEEWHRHIRDCDES